MPTARRTEAAERDLQSIAFQVALVSQRPTAADVLIDELIEQCEQLAVHSPIAEVGTSAPEIGERVRLHSYRRWVIIFRYEPHGVDVLRIADGFQDYLAWKLA